MQTIKAHFNNNMQHYLVTKLWSRYGSHMTLYAFSNKLIKQFGKNGDFFIFSRKEINYKSNILPVPIVSKTKKLLRSINAILLIIFGSCQLQGGNM